MSIHRARSAVAALALVGAASVEAYAAPVQVFTGNGVGGGANCSSAGECVIPAAASDPRTAFINGQGGVYSFNSKGTEEFNTPPYFGTPSGPTMPPFDVFGATRNIDDELVGGKGRLTAQTGRVINVPIDTSNNTQTFLGRFDTTTVGNNSVNQIPDSGWFATAGSFTITLKSLLQGGPGLTNAIGFYITDLGDSGGSVTMKLFTGSDEVHAEILVPGGTGNGGILFYGIYADKAFDSVQFLVTQNGCATSSPCEGQDVLGIDSIVIGEWSRGTTTDMPEPGTLALLAIGGLLAAKRRRRTS